MGGVQVPALLHHFIDNLGAAVGGVHLVSLLHARDYILQRLPGRGRQAKMLKPDERTEPFSKSSRHPNPLSLHIKTTPRSLQELGLSRNLWSSSPASLRLPHKDGHMLKLLGKGTCRETLHREVLAYNSRIRHSSEGVDFPEKYTKAPHV